MSEVVAGVRIPDTKLAREATDLLRELSCQPAGRLTDGRLPPVRVVDPSGLRPATSRGGGPAGFSGGPRPVAQGAER
jgi:hypothetical protein